MNTTASVTAKVVENYWSERLTGVLRKCAPPGLEAPRRSGSRHRIAVRLPPDLVRQICRAPSDADGVGFAFVVSCLAGVLARYTRESPVLVACPPRASRPAPPDTFLFLKLMRSDRTVREEFAEVRRLIAEAENYQDVCMTRVLERIVPGRASFDAMLGTLASDRRRHGAHGLTRRFALAVRTDDLAAADLLYLDYDAGEYALADIERFGLQLREAMADALARPSSPARSVALISAEERRLIDRFGQGPVTTVASGTVLTMVERQARALPDVIAARDPDRAITYPDLDAMSDRLACALRRRGVGPEQAVGVLVGPSVDAVIAALGVWKSGAALVPMDVRDPRERNSYVGTDSRAVAFLCDDESVPMRGRACWPLRALIAETRDGDPVQSQIDPRTLAYIVYSSGSTGRPKGAMIDHAALADFTAWASREYGHAPGGRTLVASSMAFDAWLLLAAPTLASGGTIVVAPPLLRVDVPEYLRCIKTNGISCVDEIPAVAQQICETASEDRCRDALSSIRTLSLGGEAVPVALARRFRRLLRADARILNAYGPAETTPLVSAYAFDGRAPDERSLIGRPRDNVRFFVADEQMRPSPIGVPGELCIGGRAVGRGYVHQPALTADRFVPDPHGDGARMYRTGDLVRWTTEGNVEYLGRADRQARIRGVRVELGEVEAALRECPAVGDAAVVVQHRAGTPILAAYVVDRRAEQTADVTALRAGLVGRLPASMIPARIVRLERLPRLASGKVDLCALSNESDADVIRRDGAEPATPLERGIAHVWCGVLGIPAVSVDDNFFELGGDSILAIQVVARIRSELRVRLTASQLLTHQTVGALAQLVRPAPDMDDVEVEGPVPLTPVQRWFFEQLPGAPGHYSQCVLLELHRPAGGVEIERVASRLVAHHDAIRSRFDRGPDGWQARIVPVTSAPAATTVIDLSRLPVTRHAFAIEGCGASLQRALSPGDGPMIRMALFVRGSQLAPRLLIAVHHLVTDALSWAILLEDLDVLLSSLANGTTVDLPSKTASYQQWARSLAQRVRAGGSQDEFEFWLRLLDRPHAPVPVDFEDGPNAESSSRVISVVFTPEMTTQYLDATRNRRRGGRHEVVLAALARAMANVTAARTVCLELEGHGREPVGDDLDVSRTVGWFSSLYPVLLDLGTSTDPGDELDAIATQLRGIPHAGIGYGLLRYLSTDPRAARLAALPRPEISFEYLGTLDSLIGPGRGFTPLDDPCGPRRDGGAERRYLLEVTAFVASGRLHVHFGYSANRYRATTVQRLADDFVVCLTALGQSRHSPYVPGDFPDVSLTQDQLDRLVSRFTPISVSPR